MTSRVCEESLWYRKWFVNSWYRDRFLFNTCYHSANVKIPTGSWHEMRLIMPVWSGQPAWDKIKLSVLSLLRIYHHQRPLIFSQFSPVICWSLRTTKLTIHYTEGGGGGDWPGRKNAINVATIYIFFVDKIFSTDKNPKYFSQKSVWLMISDITLVPIETSVGKIGIYIWVVRRPRL